MNIRALAHSLVMFAVLCSGESVLAAPAASADAAANDPDAAYTQVLTKRIDDILATLNLSDAAKVDRLRATLDAHYRALRAQHEARDAKLKETPRDNAEQIAKAKADAAAAIKPLHDDFVAKLNADLTPEQVEVVKDKMTMGKVKNDYNAFEDMLPQLTDAQKAHILAQLKEAREIAMDEGTSEAKHAVFGKYRGRINNYLAKEGYDLKKASKEWADRRKARDTQAKQAASTQPAN